MVFQDFLLFDELGAADNAAASAMFRPRRDRAAVRQAAEHHLAAFGLADLSRPVASFSGASASVSPSPAHWPPIRP
ncbi:hypothetical protein [Pseudaestuariivita atlantica]|uniref:hypothetical protein n=1 Tax=Pseudaestuariivita atlantica TaxID=1317121 RepID=UPI00241556DD|nr:hypothetical protein [Pseudaestuariivita atlantica]